ncbi:MAG: hypothetical protein K0R14_377 [Burkholderiales bacterium]|jgi:hypothetical protein|nr:hypothetical protein [Burkholderiales bacterium]
MIKDPRQYTSEYPKSNILIKLAFKILNEESNFADLKILIGNILKNENDALINVALNLSPSYHVSEIIWRALNAVINDSTETTINIFAIPVVLVAGSKVKTKLNGTLDVGRLNEFFRQNRVFGNDIDGFISGKLIDPLNLVKIKPSQIYYWARNIKNANLWLPIELEGTGIPVLNEGVFLRFLIGLGSINQEAYRNSLMSLMKLIGEELKNDAVTLFPIPFPPVNLSEGYPVGDSKRKEIAITVAISNIVRKIREQGQVPVAAISGENEAIKILVNSTTDPALSETSLWHLTKFEDYEEDVKKLTNLLQDMQVEYSYVS